MTEDSHAFPKGKFLSFEETQKLKAYNDSLLFFAQETLQIARFLLENPSHEIRIALMAKQIMNWNNLQQQKVEFEMCWDELQQQKYESECDDSCEESNYCP